jgi:hypothetical protein
VAIDQDTFEACCVAVTQQEALAFLQAALEDARRCTAEITEALAMVGRYAAKNESAIKRQWKKSKTQSVYADMIKAHEQIDRELSPVIRLLSEVTTKTLGVVSKKVALTGVLAAPDIIRSMKALFFSSFGSFVSALQIDVAGFDIDEYAEVPEDTWYASLGKKVSKRMLSLYHTMKRNGLLSTSNLLMVASFTWLGDFTQAYRYLTPQYWMRKAVAGAGLNILPNMAVLKMLCMCATYPAVMRKFVPILLRTLRREYLLFTRGEFVTDEMREQFEVFQNLSLQHPEQMEALAALATFRKARGEIVKQFERRIGDSGVAASDDVLKQFEGLIDWFDTWIFDSQWLAVVQGMCNVLSIFAGNNRMFEGQAQQKNLLNAFRSTYCDFEAFENTPECIEWMKEDLGIDLRPLDRIPTTELEQELRTTPFILRKKAIEAELLQRPDPDVTDVSVEDQQQGGQASDNDFPLPEIEFDSPIDDRFYKHEGKWYRLMPDGSAKLLTSLPQAKKRPDFIKPNVPKPFQSIQRLAKEVAAVDFPSNAISTAEKAGIASGVTTGFTLVAPSVAPYTFATYFLGGKAGLSGAAAASHAVALYGGGPLAAGGGGMALGSTVLTATGVGGVVVATGALAYGAYRSWHSTPESVQRAANVVSTVTAEDMAAAYPVCERVLNGMSNSSTAAPNSVLAFAEQSGLTDTNWMVGRSEEEQNAVAQQLLEACMIFVASANKLRQNGGRGHPTSRPGLDDNALMVIQEGNVISDDTIRLFYKNALCSASYGDDMCPADDLIGAVTSDCEATSDPEACRAVGHVVSEATRRTSRRILEGNLTARIEQDLSGEGGSFILLANGRTVKLDPMPGKDVRSDMAGYLLKAAVSICGAFIALRQGTNTNAALTPEMRAQIDSQNTQRLARKARQAVANRGQVAPKRRRRGSVAAKR